LVLRLYARREWAQAKEEDRFEPMIYAFKYAPPSGEPEPVGTGEGSGETAAHDAFEDLREQSGGVGLPAGEYQYRPIDRGGIPGVMPGVSIGPDWAPLILDADGTINV
jgi:hypothetical protein